MSADSLSRLRILQQIQHLSHVPKIIYHEDNVLVDVSNLSKRDRERIRFAENKRQMLIVYEYVKYAPISKKTFTLSFSAI